MNEVRVMDVMTSPAVALSPEETIHEAAGKLAANGISGAPVVEDGAVIGMLSESDILHAVAPDFPKRRRSFFELLVNTRNRRPAHPAWGPTVRDVMSSLVVFQISPEASIWEAAHLLEARGVKRLPVVDEEGTLVGIVARADIIRAMARPDSEIEADVRETLLILAPEMLDGLSVKVDKGIATLRGSVDRKATRRLAQRLAWNVPGVTSVQDELAYMDDRALTVDVSDSDVGTLDPYDTRRKRDAV